MTLTLKYKKIIRSIIIGLLIIPLMLLCIILSSTSTAFASTIASPGGSGTTTTTSPDSGCYKEETDTTTKVTALTKVDNCANSTDYPNGDAINPNDCYYEETIQPTSTSSPETVDEPESCAELLCQGGSTLSNGQDCSTVDPCDPTPSNPDVGNSVSCSNIIKNYINPIILFLGAGVGLVIIIMTVIGGIQYITSGGDPNHVAEAKKRIANALLALVTWIIIWAFLEWIIPGGLFK
jgi:hypothetical protein